VGIVTIILLKKEMRIKNLSASRKADWIRLKELEIKFSLLE
jgi:hypothetical protein